MVCIGNASGVDERFINQMRSDEPDLQFVGANHVGNQHIVGAFVASFTGLGGEFARLGENQFVRFKQTRNLRRHFLDAFGRMFDSGEYRPAPTISNKIEPSSIE